MLFTESNIVDIETNQTSAVPGYSVSAVYDDAILTDPDLAFGLILEKIFGSPDEKLKNQFREIIKLAGDKPSVQSLINSISVVLGKSGIKSEVKRIYSYGDVKDVEVKRKKKEISLRFKSGGKEQVYISRYGDEDEAVKIEMVLKKLFKVGELAEDEQRDYLSVYEQTVEKKDKYSKHSLFVEFLGQGLYLSFNQDYRFHPNFSFRVGVGSAIWAYSFPATVNFLAGAESSHHFELGGGVIIVGDGFVPTANFGYRFQRKNGGLFFRLAWTPIFTGEDDLPWWRWGGISIGYTF
ncbi:MAG: hypothetical protein ACP5KD_09160 [Fervidobacterium sp.]